jgi:ABC-2 type transport system ATP-binding protein
MQAIRTEKLTRRFQGRPVVDDLSLEVAPGELFGLVGPDGAGKTTVLRMLCGILTPSDGEAWVFDRSVRREPERVKELIAYVSQRFGLYLDLTVMENLRFYADLYRVGRRERRSRVERLLDFSGLAPFTARRAGHLSGGMKQKLGVACALIHRPRLLLLDEPTSGVDPISRREFWRIVNQLVAEGVTVLVSTSYLDEAERCGRVALINRGRLLACRAPEALRDLVPGRMLQVRCERPYEVHAHLRRALAGTEATLFGDCVHLQLAPGQDRSEAERRIREALGEAGLSVRDIRPVEPSLEDAFLAAVGDEAEEQLP